MPDPNAPALHRPYLLDPGEGLLLTRPSPPGEDTPPIPGIVKTAERRERFLRDSGMDEADVLSATIVSTPLPDYTRIPEGRRRWPGLSAALMWHPLMWLPPRLARPYVLVEEQADGGGHERLEGPTELAIRVALELTASGLYDADTGGWVDVLDLFGIDITAPGALDRIDAWLAGGRDDDLDRIDLSAYIDDAADPDWAVRAVAELFDDLVASTWHLVADDLSGALTGLEGSTGEQILTRLGTVMTIATGSIGDAVVGLNLNLAQRLDQIRGSLSAVPTDPQSLLGGPVSDTASALRVVARAYRPALDLLDAVREGDAGAATA